MALTSKADFQIAATQYAKGFADRLNSPVPVANGVGARFYLQGHEDGNVPKHQLNDAPFTLLTDEEGDSGKEFVAALRKVGATITIEPGEDPRQSYPRVYGKLMNAAATEIDAFVSRANADAIIDGMLRRGLVFAAPAKESEPKP